MTLRRPKVPEWTLAGPFGTILLCLSAATAWPGQSFASPRLRCEISQGADTQLIESLPATEPYAAKAVDINNKFRFKALVVGSEGLVDYVKLYAYHLGRQQPILLHEAKYLSPKALANPPSDALTGTQYLYSPKLGYEMQYRCALAEVQP